MFLTTLYYRLQEDQKEDNIILGENYSLKQFSLEKEENKAELSMQLGYQGV